MSFPQNRTIEVTSSSFRSRHLGRRDRASRRDRTGLHLERLERRDVPAVLAITVPDTSPSDQTITAGEAFNGQIASFVANDGATDGTRYQAMINWGDGNSSPATAIVLDANGSKFDISADHTYRAPAQTSIVVEVQDFWDGTNASQSANLTVLDQALTPTGSQPSVVGAVQGAPIAAQDLFTFIDGNAMALAIDFNATIHWGDGTSTAAGSIAKDADGVYHVAGGHTYQHPGPIGGYEVTASISDGASTLTLANQVPVAPAPLLLGASTVALADTSANPQGQAIIPAGTVVGSFTQAGLADLASNYMTSASFARFPGSSAATPLVVAVPSVSGGTFVVTTASDTVVTPFLSPGPSPFSVQVADGATGTLALATGQLQVADVAPVATPNQPGITTTQGSVFSGPVATFTLPFGGLLNLAGQYAATIDWGDGSPSTTGLIEPGTTSGSYLVAGSHTYAGIGSKLVNQAAGTEPVIVSIRRVAPSGASMVISNTATIADAPIQLQPDPIDLAVTSSDASGQATVPAGTVVGTFTQAGASRLTTAFAGSTATFPGSAAPTPLAFTFDPSSGVFTARTAASTPISPFLKPGAAGVPVRIVDGVGGASATATATLDVADVAPLAAPAQPTIAAAEGVPFAGPVAAFTLPFGSGTDLADQYAATIDWGDGTAPTAGTIQAGTTPGSYVVVGSHTFAGVGSKLAEQAAGTYPVAVTIDRLGAFGSSAVAANTATVADAPITLATSPVYLPVTASGPSGEASIPSGTVVGTFAEPEGARLSAAYSGSTATFPGAAGPTALTITPLTPGSDVFVASTAVATAIEPYLTPGTSSITVRIIDGVGGATAIASTPLNVSDVAPLASTVQPTASVILGGTFAGPVASFTLPFGSGLDLADQYAATIDWGDGTAPTAGTIQAGTTPGSYVVVGSHAYPGLGTVSPGQAVGTYPVTVSVQRFGSSGAGATLTNAVQVADLPISVSGVLAATSDGGVSNTDAVTNVKTPEFSGTSEPNSIVTVYAVPVGSTIVVPVGQGMTNAAGVWDIRTIPFLDGSYAIDAVAVDALGVASAFGQVLPNAHQGFLTIETSPPVVTSTRFNRQTGQLTINYGSPEGALDLASLVRPNAYKVLAPGVSSTPIAFGVPALIAADPAGRSATVRITLNHRGAFPSNSVDLSIVGSAINDAAGNELGAANLVVTSGQVQLASTSVATIESTSATGSSPTSKSRQRVATTTHVAKAHPTTSRTVRASIATDRPHG